MDISIYVIVLSFVFVIRNIYNFIFLHLFLLIKYFYSLLHFFFLIYLAELDLSCGIWDLHCIMQEYLCSSQILQLWHESSVVVAYGICSIWEIVEDREGWHMQSWGCEESDTTQLLNNKNLGFQSPDQGLNLCPLDARPILNHQTTREVSSFAFLKFSSQHLSFFIFEIISIYFVGQQRRLSEILHTRKLEE